VILPFKCSQVASLCQTFCVGTGNFARIYQCNHLSYTHQCTKFDVAIFKKLHHISKCFKIENQSMPSNVYGFYNSVF
jgi:hypothetical protein